MANITLLIGIIAICFFLIYLVINIKIGDTSWNVVFQLLGLVVVFVLMLLIPKTGLDDKNFCYLTISNSSTVGDVTSYEYSRTCFDNPNNTSNTFYKSFNVFLYILIGLLFVFFSYFLIKKLIEVYPKFRG